MVIGRNRTATTRRLEELAARWAAAGVSLATVQSELRKGLNFALLQIPQRATTIRGVEAIVDDFAVATAVLSEVYLGERCDPPDPKLRLLTAALLAGDWPDGLARDCGIGVARSYCVVALSIPPSSRAYRPGSTHVADRIRIALADHGEGVLSRLSREGGTVLWPDAGTDDVAAKAIPRLTEVVGAPLTAAAVEAATTDIPLAARQAHELLAVALSCGRFGRLYTFDDLALEYQLTRQSPARDRLAALLDPLEKYPILVDTLRLHLRDNLSRRRVARMLNIHVNTVDYRLRRIRELTGLDPFTPSGQCYLRSAVIARIEPTGPSVST